MIVDHVVEGSPVIGEASRPRYGGGGPRAAIGEPD